MLNLSLAVFFWIGNLACIGAIGCLAWHCASEFQAIAEGRFDDLLRADDVAWTGLLLLAVWAACQIGRIGL